ncbi:MAG: hypothetical protein EHM16_08215 [Betaproteobacteria bacterium]|nr:MAG: hypothetical protein EHM16_08215 [Betaproteobacteria bacterium]
MQHIIAGRFQSKDRADAVALLLEQYIAKTDICIFHNNPPGQHDAFILGGDEAADPGAEGAGTTAVNTAITAGLGAGAIGALGGPVVALAAAATGAYVGAFGGALQGLGDDDGKPHAPDNRPGGVILSVRIADPVNEGRVIATLRAEDAADIEQAEGEWLDGDWVDFDPVTAPRLVKKQAIDSASRSGAGKR